MSNSNNDTELTFLGLITLLGFIVIAWVAKQLGVDWNTGFEVVKNFLLIAILAGFTIYSGFMPFVWPLFLAGLLWGFLPALDYHAAKQTIVTPEHHFQGYQIAAETVDTPYYGDKSNQRWAILLIILAGYGFKFYREAKTPY